MFPVSEKELLIPIFYLLGSARKCQHPWFGATVGAFRHPFDARRFSWGGRAADSGTGEETGGETSQGFCSEVGP